MRNQSSHIQAVRQRRKSRTRARIKGTDSRPRLTVFRSLRYTYAQLIDDTAGNTLWAGSTTKMSGGQDKTAAAFKLGELAAAGAKEKKISLAVFDRGAYRFHGRVKAVAEGARKAGLPL